MNYSDMLNWLNFKVNKSISNEMRKPKKQSSNVDFFGGNPPAKVNLLRWGGGSE